MCPLAPQNWVLIMVRFSVTVDSDLCLETQALLHLCPARLVWVMSELGVPVSETLTLCNVESNFPRFCCKGKAGVGVYNTHLQHWRMLEYLAPVYGDSIIYIRLHKLL